MAAPIIPDGFSEFLCNEYDKMTLVACQGLGRKRPKVRTEGVIMPRGPQGERRPADTVAAAIMVAKIATGEIEEKFKAPSWQGPIWKKPGGRARGKDDARTAVGCSEEGRQRKVAMDGGSSTATSREPLGPPLWQYHMPSTYRSYMLTVL